MNKNITSILAVISVLAGFGVYQYIQMNDKAAQQPAADKQKPATKPLSMVGQKRPAFSLPDLQGKARNISEWDGKVILLNFWATWCPPCRKELPAFIELQEQYHDQGFQVIGVAIDDKQAVIDYFEGMGGNYPVMIGDSQAMDIVRDYGNRYGALPYSLVIDRDGIIRFVGKRELSFTDVEQQIKPLL